MGFIDKLKAFFSAKRNSDYDKVSEIVRKLENMEENECRKYLESLTFGELIAIVYWYACKINFIRNAILKKKRIKNFLKLFKFWKRDY